MVFAFERPPMRQNERFFPCAHVHGLVQLADVLPLHGLVDCLRLRTVPFAVAMHAILPFLSGLDRFVPGEHLVRLEVKKYGMKFYCLYIFYFSLSTESKVSCVKRSTSSAERPLRKTPVQSVRDMSAQYAFFTFPDLNH